MGHGLARPPMPVRWAGMYKRYYVKQSGSSTQTERLCDAQLVYSVLVELELICSDFRFVS